MSCVNLGIGLAQEGKKVLMIDADPQGSLTISLGYEEPDEMEYSLATLMWKNDLFFQQRKKTFTKAIAVALLKDGKVKIKGMYSTKTGKTFDGVVLLADTGGKYVNFRVEQNRK